MDTLRFLLNRLRGRPTTIVTSVLGTPLTMTVRARRELRRLRSVAKEEALLRRMIQRVRPDDVVYDIGANIGVIGLVLARHTQAGASRVFCFEPEPRNFAQLEGNIRANGLEDQVEPHQIALGEREGEVELFIRGGPGEGRHSMAEAQGSTGSIRVPMRTTANFADQVGRLPDLVKIDVEGAEGRVLAGMEGLFRQGHPRDLFMEIHPKGDEDRMPEGTPIRSWLAEQGYTLVWEFARGKTSHCHFQAKDQAS